MVRSVLLGGRTSPRISNQIVFGIFVWLPVALMLMVIVRESTEAFSSFHTARLFRPVWEAIFGPVTDAHWDEVNHVLRKSGHFLGYGTLGLTWMRAWLLTWMYPLRQRSASVWRRWSWLMAICCTATVASLDEIHQSFLPSRTGVVQDVLLDTLGSAVLCSLISLLWVAGRQRNVTFVAAR